MDAGCMAMMGRAGFSGADIRGDCSVVATADGLGQIQMGSRVAALYGSAIRAQIQEVIASVGAEGVSLEVQDEGALPYVIGARIEAAIKRAIPEATGCWLPPQDAVAKADSKPLRSRLYLPGNTPKFFLNACLYGADGLILDLEDSVAPTEKDVAIILARNALRAMEFRNSMRIVRIVAGPDGIAQARALVPHGVQAFILPKVETALEVQALDTALEGSTPIIALIETAKGVAKAMEVAEASPRLIALSIGLEDYLSDLGASRSETGVESAWAYSQVINAARSAGLQALGPVFSDIDNLGGLQATVQRLAGLGFDGFSCIHPSQVRVIHSALHPSEEAVRRAREVLVAYERGLAEGVGAVSVNGKMVDAPVAAQARRTLLRAGAPE